MSILKRPLFRIAALLFLSICAFFRGHAAEFGDAYVTGSSADAVNLIPFISSDAPSHAITGMIFNGLTKTDKDLNIVGDLAEDWDVSEEGLVVTFELREDVRWHDGSPLTAYDVKFTFDSILDPENGCPYIASYQDIKSVDVLDEHTVRFTYSEPYAPALSKLGVEIVPRHLLEGVELRKSDFKRSPLGTGPYTFGEWRNNQHIILDSNHDYFEHRPYIERYVTRVIPDSAVQFLELVARGIDTMSLSAYQYFYRTHTAKFKENYDKYTYLSRSYTYIGYNLKDDLFKDVRVRRALSYAINKEKIIDGVLMGLGEPCTGPFFKGTSYYDEEAAAYDHDKKKAAALLNEAGWSDSDGDGILDKDGKPFKCLLFTNQGNKEREDIVTFVQREWSEIGVDVEVQVLQWAAFLKNMNEKNFQSVILGWTMPIDPDCYNVWHSEASREGGLNFISYENERVDELIIAGRRTFDPDEREDIYREIHRIIADDAPYTFLYFPYARIAVSKRFKGIEPAPAGIGYNFIDWYVDSGDWRY